MIREVDMAYAMQAHITGKDVRILTGDKILRFGDLLENARYLVDEEPMVRKVETAAINVEKDANVRRTSKKEQEILAAWKGGDRSIKEIMEITGCSYATVRKYIPAESEVD